MLIPFLIFLAFAIAIFIFRNRMEERCERIYGTGIKAEGEVLSHMKGTDGNLTTVKFEYIVDGKSYERFFSVKRPPSVGKTIDIYYDALDPEEAIPADTAFLEIYRQRTNLYLIVSVLASIASLIIGVAMGNLI